MTLGEGLRDKAAVVGIGETEYSKESGRTELALACEAISKAADDAGIPVSEIDGLVRYDMDSVDEVALTSHLGLEEPGLDEPHRLRRHGRQRRDRARRGGDCGWAREHRGLLPGAQRAVRRTATARRRPGCRRR